MIYIKNINFSIFDFIDIPNILFMEYNENSQNFYFKTTKFVGPNAQSSELKEVITLDLNCVQSFKDVLSATNLFPIKVKNLHEREIGLAIFNYMPYTIWKEVVSTYNKISMNFINLNFKFAEWN